MTNKNNKDKKPSEPTNQSSEKADNTAAKSSQANKTADNKPTEQTATSSTTQAEPKEKQKNSGTKVGVVAIVIALLIGGGLTFQMQQNNAQYQNQINALQAELKQTKSKIKSSQQQAIAKATDIAHRTETLLEQQQKSIESLQLAVADVKGRRPNDWLLAEADYLVKLAGRKLFLEHDAVSATQLMESADQRIAALNDPSLVPLRKSMASDITKLKSIPLLDREGLVLRLTALQQQVDSLPLANAIMPKAKQVEKSVVSQDVNDWQDNLMTSLKDFSNNFITFRTRDGNVIPLLSPQQHFYLQENIKAKLETAIKAVYLEQQEIYKIALTTANKWSSSFFNQDSAEVQSFTKTLGELSEQKVQVEYPVKLETQQQLSDVIRDRLRREVTGLVKEGN